MLNPEETIPVSIDHVLRNQENGRETVIDIANELDEDEVPHRRVTFGMRDVAPEVIEPTIAEARARDHEFHSLKEFGDYLVRECQPISNAVALADVSENRIVAVLDEKTGNDREQISFLAKLHPLFQPWWDLIGKSTDVREFALFVMQQRSSIVRPEGREMALLFSQVKSSKKVTKRVGFGAKAINGVMVEIQIGSESKEHEIELPESVDLFVPLFLGLSQTSVTLDLVVHEDKSGNLCVGVTAPGIEERRVEAFSDMVDSLREQTEMIVGLGQVKHRDWRTIK